MKFGSQIDSFLQSHFKMPCRVSSIGQVRPHGGFNIIGQVTVTGPSTVDLEVFRNDNAIPPVLADKQSGIFLIGASIN